MCPHNSRLPPLSFSFSSSLNSQIELCTVVSNKVSNLCHTPVFIWTVDRRSRQGLQHESLCQLPFPVEKIDPIR